MHWEAETTEVQPPARVVYQSVEAPFPFTLAFTLVDRDGATEVQHDGSTGGMSGFFGKLADSLVALMYQRDMNSNLANLKAILEATGVRQVPTQPGAQCTWVPLPTLRFESLCGLRPQDAMTRP